MNMIDSLVVKLLQSLNSEGGAANILESTQAILALFDEFSQSLISLCSHIPMESRRGTILSSSRQYIDNLLGVLRAVTNPRLDLKKIADLLQNKCGVLKHSLRLADIQGSDSVLIQHIQVCGNL